MEVNREKTITHHSYKNKELLLMSPRLVQRRIDDHPKPIHQENVGSKGLYKCVTDENLELNQSRYSAFITLVFSFVGGVFFYQTDVWDTFVYIVVSTCALLVVLCILYMLFYPKKKEILDRKNGLITFSGVLYGKNITMDFNEVIFWYSTGGEDALGAFNLQIVRPNNGIYADFNLGQGDCYKDMSLIAWYMDKNRPLPPGEAFDPYRQKDFERRKAAGFPRPLYPSSVHTPEATLEQQKEREKIGKW